MSNKVYWKQRNGELIDIDDMDINHLRNTLKLVLRNRHTVIKQMFKSKTNYIELHGDMANESHLSDEDDDRFEDSFDNEHSYTRKLRNKFNDLPESMDIGNNELGLY
jgi:hypothetical protein